jgi:hypothetical protein
MDNEKNHNNQQPKKRVIRKPDDLKLKEQLLSSPELFITEKGSDEYLDRLALKIKLIGGDEFILSDYVAGVIADYESKFKKDWFYRLADICELPRNIMDTYVKPDFVRKFIIQFVYGRFHYMILRTLRSRNRKTSTEENRTKLFQHLTKDASQKLDVVIEQVYTMMGVSKNLMDFKMKYSKEYKIYFQLDLF